MPITYKTNVVVMEGVCSIDEGDQLLQWLIEHPKGKINLKQVTHIHTALLQILLCLHPFVSILPEDAKLRRLWLEAVSPMMENSQ